MCEIVEYKYELGVLVASILAISGIAPCDSKAQQVTGDSLAKAESVNLDTNRSAKVQKSDSWDYRHDDGDADFVSGLVDPLTNNAIVGAEHPVPIGVLATPCLGVGLSLTSAQTQFSPD